MRSRPWLARFLALLVLPAALLAAACGVSTVGGATPVPPTATPKPTCATLLPGAVAAAPITGFTDVPSPAGANMKGPTTSAGGTGQFKIIEYDFCFTGTLDQVTGPFSAHKAITANLLGEGWGVSTIFPYTGDLEKSCASNCYQNGQYERLLTLETITDQGGGLITYHLRLAAPPPAPACGPNFTGSPIHGYQTTGQNGMPLPPLTLVAPDDASGGLRGNDLCSAGTAASITAFLNGALPATGWTHGADSRCFYSAQCWTKGGNAISWDVSGGATDWMTAYRQPIA